MKNEYLEPLLEELKEKAPKTRQLFGGITENQLNYKPSSNQWSVGECLDHIMTLNRQYFPVIEALNKGQYPKPFWGKVPGWAGFCGNSLKKFVHPDNLRKTKTVAPFFPRKSQFKLSILDEFADHQEQLAEVFMSSDELDHKRTIITSPASKLFVYNLEDAFTVIVWHEERHIRQAKRVLDRQGALH